MADDGLISGMPEESLRIGGPRVPADETRDCDDVDPLIHIRVGAAGSAAVTGEKSF